jgi:Tfp pilus assembly protein PilF
MLADIYMRAAKSQYAIGTMERAAMLFPDSINTYLKLAEYQIVVRQYDRASSSLRRAMTLEPQNLEALHLLGLMYQEQGNPDRAIQTYQTITELNSEDAEAWTQLGNLLDQQNDPRALQCFENAIDADPKYPQGWHSKAFYLQNHGKIPEAIEIYRQIHGIDSTYADAWLNRGILHLELNETSEAQACFDYLIGLDNNSAAAYYYSGIAATKAGNRELARTYLERAKALQPSSERIDQAIRELE